MLVVQCMHDHLLKRQYPSVRIDEKNQIKHDLGKRLYGGNGQNKIGGTHLAYVGIAMHA